MGGLFRAEKKMPELIAFAFAFLVMWTGSNLPDRARAAHDARVPGVPLRPPGDLRGCPLTLEFSCDGL